MALHNGVDLKVMSGRSHANMAYTLTYTHRSTGRDRPATEKVAEVIFCDGWDAPTTPDDTVA